MKFIQKLILASVSVGVLAACSGGSNVVDQGTVTASGTISSTISVNPVSIGSPTILSVTLANAGTTALSGGAFTIPLPAGFKSSNVTSLASPCGQTSWSIGASGFILSGVSIPAGTTCTAVAITLTLSPSAAGTNSFAPTGLTGFTAGTTAASLVTNPATGGSSSTPSAN